MQLNSFLSNDLSPHKTNKSGWTLLTYSFSFFRIISKGAIKGSHDFPLRYCLNSNNKFYLIIIYPKKWIKANKFKVIE